MIRASSIPGIGSWGRIASTSSSAFSSRRSSSTSSPEVSAGSRWSSVRIPTSCAASCLRSMYRCEAGSSPTRTVARPSSPSSATSSFTAARTFAASARPSISVAAISADGELDVADVDAERAGEADAELDVLTQALHVARLHRPSDPGALARPPERVRDEDGEQPVRRVDEVALRLLRCGLEEHPLVRHPRAVVDAVVHGEPVAEILEHRAPRRARDAPEPTDHQPRVASLHNEALRLDPA